MSHLGSRVSALLDGRLAPEEEERCWSHVHACHACRDLVEQEGWVKTQLAQLSFGPAPAVPRLQVRAGGPLLGHAARCRPRSGRPPFPTVRHRPRRGLVAIGGGAASACVVGVLALGVAGAPRVDPRPPVTDLSRPTGPASPAVTGDDRAARGRFTLPDAPGRAPRGDPGEDCSVSDEHRPDEQTPDEQVTDQPLPGAQDEEPTQP